MAQAWAKTFYQSTAWKQCRLAYINSKFNLCERCGKAGYIVHHKVKLTMANVDDARVTLAWENLELLCLDCHNAEHMANDIDEGFFFDRDGYLVTNNPRGDD